MNLNDLHQQTKAVSVSPLFKCSEGSVTAIRIVHHEQLKEHLTKIPALLICVTGNVNFENEKGLKVSLSAGDYITIEPLVKHWLNAISDSNLLLVK